LELVGKIVVCDCHCRFWKIMESINPNMGLNVYTETGIKGQWLQKELRLTDLCAIYLLIMNPCQAIPAIYKWERQMYQSRVQKVKKIGEGLKKVLFPWMEMSLIGFILPDKVL
jgi:hypothetical protein